MNKRDIVIGLAVLVILAGVIYWRQRSRPNEELRVPETLSTEEQLENKFNVTLPDDVEKAELQDVSDGNASGVATRKFENGRFAHSILADLPEPESGIYQGWLVRGEEGSENYSLIATGQVKSGKGGWMVEFQSSTDLSDHAKVLITQEVTSDRNIEKIVLEGSF